MTGVDSSPTLIGLCRSRFPGETWIAGDMREVSLSRRFGGVVAWNSFFHLTPEDQRAMFRIFKDHADPAEYEALLAAHGFSTVQHVIEDQDCGGLTVWLARTQTP